MMVTLRLLFVLAAALALIAPAAAAEPGVIESIRFESHPDRLDFIFTASSPIDGSLAEVIPARKGEVLILRLGGITARRKWVKTRDRAIRRTLLHPSTQRPPGAILRVRFKKRVITRGLIKDIKAEYLGDDRRTVVISVPRPGGERRAAPTEPRRPPSDPPPEPKPAAEPPPSVEPTPPATPPPTDLEPAEPPAIAPAPVMQAGKPTIEAVIAPPAARTADVRGGLDGVVDRLRLGIEQRPGVPRVAILPVTALDDASHRDHLDGTTTALLGARMLRRPGLVQVEPARFAAGLERLHRGEDGRFALDDARALAAMLGADTLIAGSVMTDGPTVTVAGRAIDVETGRDLGATGQPFDRQAMRALSDRIREEQSAGSAIAKSALLPGLGQISQGHTGRGAGYLTGFVATLGAGIISVALGAAAEADYEEDDPSTADREDDAHAHYARSSAFFVTAGAIWLASLVDAIVTSEHQVEYDLSADADRR